VKSPEGLWLSLQRKPALYEFPKIAVFATVRLLATSPRSWREWNEALIVVLSGTTILHAQLLFISVFFTNITYFV
jgi:hypothetical protein